MERFKGINFGNWLLWEGCSLGMPNYGETILRGMMADRMRPEKVNLFFDSFVTQHTKAEDFIKAKSEGLNVIRLPFHYRYVTESPSLLDQAVVWAKKAGIGIILDLHAAPGSQSNTYHADSTGAANFWTDTRNVQEFFALWDILVNRYKDNRFVVAYEPLNEPNVGDGSVLTRVYQLVIDHIRKIDPVKPIILDGNFHASNPSVFEGIKGDNLIYSFHSYADTPEEMIAWLKREGWNEHYEQLFCGEYNINIGMQEHFERFDIGNAPWVWQKLSQRWVDWIADIWEGVYVSTNLKSEFFLLIQGSDLPRKCGKDLYFGIDPRKLRRSITVVTDKYPAEKAAIEELYPEINRLVETCWVDNFCQTLDGMKDGEITGLMSVMRDRTGSQFIPEGTH